MRNYGLALIVAFCSFCYEFLLIKEISFISDGNFFFYAWVIGFYILSLGGGYWYVQTKNRELELFKVEMALSLFGGLSLLFIRLADFLSSILFYNNLYTITSTRNISRLIEASVYTSNLPQIGFFVFISVVIGFLGFLSGMEMPLLIRRSKTEDAHVFLGLSYLGSVAASVLLVYFGLFYFPIEYLFAFVAVINLLVLLMIKLDKVSVIYTLLCSIIIYGSMNGSKVLEQWEAQVTYYHKGEKYTFKRLKEVLKTKPKIQIVKTPYQRIDKVLTENYGQRDIQVYLDKHFQFSSLTEHFYHEGMVQVPLFWTGFIPKRVLVLGGGDGLLLRELLKHKQIEHIKHVELDKDFLDFCKNDFDFKTMNAGSLEQNNRVKRVFTDAYKYLKDNKNSYDLVLVDFPYPHNYDLAKLYSLEFFKMVKRAMAQKAIMVMDLPIKSSHMLSKQDYKGILRKVNNALYSTIKMAGHSQTKYYQVAGEGFVMAYQGISLKNHIEYSPLYMSKLRPDLLKFIEQDIFEFKEDNKNINSIFRPNFLMFQDYRLKF